MPDFDKLHEKAKELAELTGVGEREGDVFWSLMVGKLWKEIAEMWIGRKEGEIMSQDIFGKPVEGIGEQVKFGFPLRVLKLELLVTNMDLTVMELAKSIAGLSLIIHTQGATHMVGLTNIPIRGLPDIWQGGGSGKTSEEVSEG